jgi:hypothetical protein
MKPEDIDKNLLGLLENEGYYSLEELSSKLNVDKADIHRSFMRLCKLEGWSIRPYNRLPYWRQDFYGASWDKVNQCVVRPYPRHNRGRAKGEKYDHDTVEPDWLRTKYVVRRPEL